MDGLAFVDGRLIDLKDARVPLLDRGFLLGDGIFETLRTAHGQVFRLDDHAVRFRTGLKALGLEEAIEDLFRETVAELVAGGVPKFGDDLYLRVQATTGVTEDLAGTEDGAIVTGFCKPFKPYPLRHYSHGVHMVLSRRRVPTEPVARGAKPLSFLPHVLARREALTVTAHDAVLLNFEGRVAEATTSNVFAVKDGVAYAPGPDEGAVDGVTRAIIIELLEDTGVDVQPRLELDVLRGADEAFVTNTIGGVIPVTRFEDAPVGDGGKGELTTRLGHAYEDLVRGR